MAFPDQTIRYPFGEADSQTLTSASTIAVSVTNSMTIATVSLDTDATINVTIDEDLPVGAQLVIIAASDGTARDITCGTNLTGPAIAGVISKTKVAHFVYNGSAFVATAAAVQID